MTLFSFLLTKSVGKHPLYDCRHNLSETLIVQRLGSQISRHNGVNVVRETHFRRLLVYRLMPHFNGVKIESLLLTMAMAPVFRAPLNWQLIFVSETEQLGTSRRNTPIQNITVSKYSNLHWILQRRE